MYLSECCETETFERREKTDAKDLPNEVFWNRRGEEQAVSGMFLLDSGVCDLCMISEAIDEGLT